MKQNLVAALFVGLAGAVAAAPNPVAAPAPAPSFDPPPPVTITFTVAPNGDFVSNHASPIHPPSGGYNPIIKVSYDINRARCKPALVMGCEVKQVFVGYCDSKGRCQDEFGQVIEQYCNFDATSTTKTDIALPADIPVGNLAVWFKCVGDNVVYDSNFGKNWNFDIVV